MYKGGHIIFKAVLLISNGWHVFGSNDTAVGVKSIRLSDNPKMMSKDSPERGFVLLIDFILGDGKKLLNQYWNISKISFFQHIKYYNNILPNLFICQARGV